MWLLLLTTLSKHMNVMIDEYRNYIEWYGILYVEFETKMRHTSNDKYIDAELMFCNKRTWKLFQHSANSSSILLRIYLNELFSVFSRVFRCLVGNVFIQPQQLSNIHFLFIYKMNIKFILDVSIDTKSMRIIRLNQFDNLNISLFICFVFFFCPVRQFCICFIAYRVENKLAVAKGDIFSLLNHENRTARNRRMKKYVQFKNTREWNTFSFWIYQPYWINPRRNRRKSEM